VVKGQCWGFYSNGDTLAAELEVICLDANMNNKPLFSRDGAVDDNDLCGSGGRSFPEIWSYGYGKGAEALVPCDSETQVGHMHNLAKWEGIFCTAGYFTEYIQLDRKLDAIGIRDQIDPKCPHNPYNYKNKTHVHDHGHGHGHDESVASASTAATVRDKNGIYHIYKKSKTGNN